MSINRYSTNSSYNSNFISLIDSDTSSEVDNEEFTSEIDKEESINQSLIQDQIEIAKLLNTYNISDTPFENFVKRVESISFIRDHTFPGILPASLMMAQLVAFVSSIIEELKSENTDALKRITIDAFHLFKNVKNNSLEEVKKQLNSIEVLLNQYQRGYPKNCSILDAKNYLSKLKLVLNSSNCVKLLFVTEKVRDMKSTFNQFFGLKMVEHYVTLTRSALLQFDVFYHQMVKPTIQLWINSLKDFNEKKLKGDKETLIDLIRAWEAELLKFNLLYEKLFNHSKENEFIKLLEFARKYDSKEENHYVALCNFYEDFNTVVDNFAQFKEQFEVLIKKEPKLRQKVCEKIKGTKGSKGIIEKAKNLIEQKQLFELLKIVTPISNTLSVLQSDHARQFDLGQFIYENNIDILFIQQNLTNAFFHCKSFLLVNNAFHQWKKKEYPLLTFSSISPIFFLQLKLHKVSSCLQRELNDEIQIQLFLKIKKELLLVLNKIQVAYLKRRDPLISKDKVNQELNSTQTAFENIIKMAQDLPLSKNKKDFLHELSLFHQMLDFEFFLDFLLTRIGDFSDASEAEIDVLIDILKVLEKELMQIPLIKLIALQEDLSRLGEKSMNPNFKPMYERVLHYIERQVSIIKTISLEFFQLQEKTRSVQAKKAIILRFGILFSQISKQNNWKFIVQSINVLTSSLSSTLSLEEQENLRLQLSNPIHTLTEFYLHLNLYWLSFVIFLNSQKTCSANVKETQKCIQNPSAEPSSLVDVKVTNDITNDNLSFNEKIKIPQQDFSVKTSKVSALQLTYDILPEFQRLTPLKMEKEPEWQAFLRSLQMQSCVENILFYEGALKEMTQNLQACGHPCIWYWVLNAHTALALEQAAKLVLAFHKIKAKDSCQHILFDSQSAFMDQKVRALHDLSFLSQLITTSLPFVQFSADEKKLLGFFDHTTKSLSRYPYNPSLKVLAALEGKNFLNEVEKREPSKELERIAKEVQERLTQAFLLINRLLEIVKPSLSRQLLTFQVVTGPTPQFTLKFESQDLPSIEKCKRHLSNLLQKKVAALFQEALTDLADRENLKIYAIKNLKHAFSILTEISKLDENYVETKALVTTQFSGVILELSVILAETLLPLTSNPSSVNENSRHLLFDEGRFLSDHPNPHESHQVSTFVDELRLFLGREFFTENETMLLKKVQSILKSEVRYPCGSKGEFAADFVSLHTHCEWRRAIFQNWVPESMEMEIQKTFEGVTSREALPFINSTIQMVLTRIEERSKEFVVLAEKILVFLENYH